MDIGEFLAYRRKQLGLSLSDVGSVIGYTPQAIYRYEKGIVKIDLSLVDSFCRVLDLSIKSFFKMDPKAISSYQNEKFVQNAFCTLLQSELDREPGIVHKIAAELNVSPARVEKWCNGISLPSVGDFIVLSNILGYQPTDLYLGHERKIVVAPTSNGRCRSSPWLLRWPSPPASRSPLLYPALTPLIRIRPPNPTSRL